MPSVSPQFQAYILELLAPLQPLARRMFSGVGLFHGGVMFALLVRDVMYLRVDDTTRERYEDAGCSPFRYTRQGREVALGNYYAIPDSLFDEPDAMLIWARDAVTAARAARRR